MIVYSNSTSLIPNCFIVWPRNQVPSSQPKLRVPLHAAYRSHTLKYTLQELSKVSFPLKQTAIWSLNPPGRWPTIPAGTTTWWSCRPKLSTAGAGLRWTTSGRRRTTYWKTHAFSRSYACIMRYTACTFNHCEPHLFNTLPAFHLGGFKLHLLLCLKTIRLRSASCHRQSSLE